MGNVQRMMEESVYKVKINRDKDTGTQTGKTAEGEKTIGFLGFID